MNTLLSIPTPKLRLDKTYIFQMAHMYTRNSYRYTEKLTTYKNELGKSLQQAWKMFRSKVAELRKAFTSSGELRKNAVERTKIGNIADWLRYVVTQGEVVAIYVDFTRRLYVDFAHAQHQKVFNSNSDAQFLYSRIVPDHKYTYDEFITAVGIDLL